MCGIIGITTKHESDLAEMLKESLRRLTYRGYDSSGVGILVNDQIQVIKNKGDARHLKLPVKIKSKVGIGHTRWATHGNVTKTNAHPHSDCSGNIAVVHNGIIDNHAQLRAELEQLGHKFKSETDTEVIPHLLEEKLRYYNDRQDTASFLKAFRDMIQQLEGTYAIAALWNGDGKVYAACRISPLLIGFGRGSNFIASDISAFLAYTNEFMPLSENKIAVISVDEIELYGISDKAQLEPLPLEKSVYPFKIEQMSKGKYKHFMLKEIKEQGRVLAELLQEQNEIENVAVILASKISNSTNKIRQIYFTGCGSSFHACINGEYIFERLLHIPSKAVISSEFKTSIRNINLDDSLIVVLSQSGETLDTYMVLDEISKLQKKPQLLLVVNKPFSSQERLVIDKLNDCAKVLHLHARPEICVVATKTYTAELYLLAMLAIKIGKEIFVGTERLDVERYEDEAREIPDKVRQILESLNKADSLNAKVVKLAEKYTRFCNDEVTTSGNREVFFVIGRAMNLGNAYEAALKFREICYVSALGIAGGELKHGSLAAMDWHTPVIVLFPPQTEINTWKSTLNNFREVQARGAPIISICCDGETDKQVLEFSKDVISVPGASWLFCPILQIIYLQFLSYKMALEKKGINPDNPQHLAKTVTVE